MTGAPLAPAPAAPGQSRARQDAGNPEGRSPEGLSRAGTDAKRLTEQARQDAKRRRNKYAERMT